MAQAGMTMELHVWNRAFGLPSLDAECLAAIAFLSIAIPQDLWVLVESNNAGLSPNGALPALKDSARWIAGFDAIIEYVNTKSSGRSNIDRLLSPLQRAQATASVYLSIHLPRTNCSSTSTAPELRYRSFIRKTCQPIVALSLYMTPKNWVTVTRPLYSTFIRFPLQYEIPHTHHARAASLAAHLAPLVRELGSPVEDGQQQPISTSFAGLTTSKLSKSEDNASGDKITTRVKLRNLLADVLDPIREKLRAGTSSLLLHSESPTTVDCLLAGYLSLLVYPDLPAGWAKEILQREFADIISYTDALRPRMFPDDIACQQPAAADELSVSRWIGRGVEGLPQQLLGWDDGIPLDEAGLQQPSSAWIMVRCVLAVAAAVGGVFAYRTSVGTGAAVDVEVEDDLGAPVYAAATSSTGGAATQAAVGVHAGSEAESERLPIFRAEDMLGLKL
ncbi:Metaxin-1 [Drechslerella dactyloides]|uniref:Metaxin-1 n=1 Tax=Drechslerella dactyloides TaxID=74499 RepID=A0AAD6NK01_DREDA|nr:Metaxin-1 [Drechslerella dactyloides]